MAQVPHGVEILPRILIVWVGCTNVTDDRQTDRRQTDGPSMTYSEHELEFTFAKNPYAISVPFNIFPEPEPDSEKPDIRPTGTVTGYSAHHYSSEAAIPLIAASLFAPEKWQCHFEHVNRFCHLQVSNDWWGWVMRVCPVCAGFSICSVAAINSSRCSTHSGSSSSRSRRSATATSVPTSGRANCSWCFSLAPPLSFSRLRSATVYTFFFLFSTTLYLASCLIS